VSDSLARARLARAALRLKRRAGCALPALVLMTDDERLLDPLAATRALPRGGLVVARARDRARLKSLCASLLTIARRNGVAVAIAGDGALAARAGADGLHLPEARAGELPHWRARCPALLITVSAHSPRALMYANIRRADAVFLSPVFATASHPGSASLSAVRANLMARQCRVPVYALGGIDARNAALLSGFAGIAAIGALRV